MRDNVINKFNRGEIDSKAISRDDVEKVRNSCTSLVNFFPLRLGPMMYRQGTEYIGASGADNYLIPFVASDTDYALLSFSSTVLNVWINDVELAYVNATTSLLNQSFTSNITSWTDASGAGSSTSWDSTLQALKLVGNDTTSAISYQTSTSTDTGSEHTLTITVLRAPVKVQIGESGQGSSGILDAELAPGKHYLFFTPAAHFTITFSNSKKYSALVDSALISTSTSTIDIVVPFITAELPNLKYAQSADVVFIAYSGTADILQRPYRIERRGTKSWSAVEVRNDDGPFAPINDTAITLTATALFGDTVLTASDALFLSTSVGDIYKLSSAGQVVTASVTAQDTGTGGIFVTGISNGRTFIVTLTGTWAATVTLQRSSDNSTWTDTDTTWTANVDATYNDALDNAVFYYRLHVKTGDFTSGTVVMTLDYAAGSIDGVCRIYEYTSATSVKIQVLTDFGSTDATKDWFEGAWSSTLGFPSALALYEGRLWYAGRDKLWGSVSDAYASFDTSLTGDSKAITRTIGFGPVQTINWLQPSTRLMMGSAAAEISVRSSTFGEPLTDDNTNLKASSTQGSNNIDPLLIDDSIYYVQRSGIKVFSAEYAPDRDAHTVADTTLLNAKICSAGIKRIAVSRQPETRIWVVLDDGNARCYLLDKTEAVAAWSKVEMDGTILDVCVLPGTDEDQVYFNVTRTGGTYLEKLAQFDEAEGATSSKHFDSFKTYTSPGTTITIAHLDTKTVGVWADGQDRGTYTVASNTITVATAWTTVIVGLPHVADYVSNKISGYMEGNVLNKRKRIVDTGLVTENHVPGALTIGPSVALLEQLPDTEGGTDVVTTTTFTEYDYLPFEFNGEEESDPRIFMRATGPVTILSLTYDVLHSGEGDE